MTERAKKRGAAGNGPGDPSAELYRKDVVGTLLETRGEVNFEREIQRRLHADLLFTPAPQRRSREDLGLFDRMADLGECIIELYSAIPTPGEGRDCIVKHLGLHGQLGNRARRNRERAPALQHLWIISPGRPLGLMRTLGMIPMDGWPEGFWRMHGELRAHLIVVNNLPETRDTLFLRLLGKKQVLIGALRQLDELPRRSRVRRMLTQVVLAWRDKIIETIEEENDAMLLAETKARFAELKNQVYTEGLTQGRREGSLAGERTMLLKMLGGRFGPLPAPARRRVQRASVASLERWAERLLTAKTLDQVFQR